jgi:cell division protein FtsB
MGSAKLRPAKRKGTSREENFQALLRHYGPGLLAVLMLVLVVHDIFGTHGFLAMRRTQNEIQKVQAGIEKLNKENRQLEEEVRALKTDPQAIEKIAREELGKARPGEIIIKIPQAQPPQQGPALKP